MPAKIPAPIPITPPPIGVVVPYPITGGIIVGIALQADGTIHVTPPTSGTPTSPGSGADGDVVIDTDRQLEAPLNAHSLLVQAGVTLTTGGFDVNSQTTIDVEGTIECTAVDLTATATARGRVPYTAIGPAQLVLGIAADAVGSPLPTSAGNGGGGTVVLSAGGAITCGPAGRIHAGGSGSVPYQGSREGGTIVINAASFTAPAGALAPDAGISLNTPGVVILHTAA